MRGLSARRRGASLALLCCCCAGGRSHLGTSAVDGLTAADLDGSRGDLRGEIAPSNGLLDAGGVRGRGERARDDLA